MNKFGRTLNSMLSSSRVTKYGSAPDAASQLAEIGHRLPPLHRELLTASDGLTGYGGYFRIFGVTEAVADLAVWNAQETWKFAWPPLVSEFLCFGETAWGDQYAYRIEDLESESEPAVYFLESITLRPEGLASDFTTFMNDEFLRNCNAPYDEFLVAARKKLGDLAPSEHITYAPSPLVTGEESLDHVVKMPATAAMIACGDLARQLSGELESRRLTGIEDYTDESGRPRLKAIWDS